MRHICICIGDKSYHKSNATRRGHSFLKVNEELLFIYAGCDTSEQVIAAQAAHMDRMAAGQEAAAARKSVLVADLQHHS